MSTEAEKRRWRLHEPPGQIRTETPRSEAYTELADAISQEPGPEILQRFSNHAPRPLERVSALV